MKQFEPDKELIDKAATLIEAGQYIYIDTQTKEIIKASELEEEKIPEHLLPVVPMGSKDFFDLMKDFGCTIDDIEFRAVLYDLLGRNHPFSRFKEFIDSSVYREDWYKYRRIKYIEWVKKQISDYNLLGRITK